MDRWSRSELFETLCFPASDEDDSLFFHKWRITGMEVLYQANKKGRNNVALSAEDSQRIGKLMWKESVHESQNRTIR